MNIPNSPFLAPIAKTSICLLLPLAITTAVSAQWLEHTNAEQNTKLRVWASDGGDKVPLEEVRALSNDIAGTNNKIWDGEKIVLSGARNEIVSFSVIAENGGPSAAALSASFQQLSNDSFNLETTNASPSELFNWRDRPIEVFVIDYLRVLGLSKIAHELYDETHIPEKLRRPFTSGQPVSPAVGQGLWTDRPHHDKSYPDIAIPQELRPSTSVSSQTSQIFWVDIYIPKSAPAGVLTGSFALLLDDNEVLSIPVELTVMDFGLPDERQSKTMLYIEATDIKERYFTGVGQVLDPDDEAAYRKLIDRHFMLAWRHGVSLIDANELLPDTQTSISQPNNDWIPRLIGELYTDANGYDGPGKNDPHDVFSIGTYGVWTYWWQTRDYHPLSPSYDPLLPESGLRAILEQRSNEWESWFRSNAPQVERFLYVEDEPSTTSTRSYAEQIAGLVASNPGVGGDLNTFVTANPVLFGSELPSASILGAQIDVAPTVEWDLSISLNPQRQNYFYNGRRPASGTFMIDDDGVALRELSWGQYKKGVDRWFYWNSTYYNNFQGGEATRNLTEVGPDGAEDFRLGTQTNVLKSAHTFGGHSEYNPVAGEAGFNYGNGDGVLFYPGTDVVFPASSLGFEGPIASLRLKHWRRGIQDIQYIALAMNADPTATQLIIDRMVPEALWEIGVQEASDPTYIHKPPSWSFVSDDWEQARRDLAEIIVNDICAATKVEDSDGDGVCDNVDNCTNVANATQIDADGDGYGNECDADFDNSCRVDIRDYLEFRGRFRSADPEADLVPDGVVDLRDFLALRRLFRKPPGPSALAQCPQ